MIHRLRAACKTNETQMFAVVGFTALNAIALLKRTGYTPMWLIVIALLIWPVLAFLSNLYDPIPPEREE